MNEKPGFSEAKASCCVVVLFEDAPAREQAVNFCDHLVERFWAEQELQVEWWDFAQLRNPEQVHDSFEKTMQADIIVIATNPSSDLPPYLRDWVEAWIPLRAEREGAVVGLLDPDGRPGVICPPKFVYLRNAAHRAGMDYWTDVPETLSRSVPDSLESYSERAVRITSVLDEILHYHPAPTI